MQTWEYWLRLALVKGLSIRQKHNLAVLFNGPEAIIQAHRGRFREHLPAPAALELEQLVGNIDSQQLASTYSWLDGIKRRFIGFDDRRYPALLKQIPDPPLGLFTHGDCSLLNAGQISVVGSRQPTPGGAANARRIAGGLAQSGYVVCSGMATGIDTCAHRGAIIGGGHTVAVLGSGPDVCYPQRNRRLYEKISREHLVVSELPPRTLPLPYNFPIRNRIISGMSAATLVVEARQKSGSLITARLAAEQGRDVLAVPGPATSGLSSGCHKLIREGAALVTNSDEVLQAIGIEPQGRGIKTELCGNSGPDPELTAVLRLVDYSPTTYDQLVDESGLTIEQLSYILIKLESNGHIRRVSGGAFVRLDQD